MKKVLVVDDSASVRQQVSLALTQAGLEVVEAKDGSDGLAKVSSRPDIGLIISDVNMPNMNGLEMVQAVKKLPVAAKLPIIMLTTEGNPALMAEGKKAGATGWMIKPFKAEILVSAVKKLMAG